MNKQPNPKRLIEYLRENLDSMEQNLIDGSYPDRIFMDIKSMRNLADTLERALTQNTSEVQEEATDDARNIEVTPDMHFMSTNHRAELEKSKKLGCFHCLEKFEVTDIKEWVDKDQTAMCPRCGIDSVIPLKELSTDDELLKTMRDKWFGWGINARGERVKINY